MIARVVGVIFLRSSSAVTLRVSGSMSQNTGRPPAWTIAWVAETKVIELVNTSWPSTSAAIMARCRAAVRGVERHGVADTEVTGETLLERKRFGTASDPAAGQDLGYGTAFLLAERRPEQPQAFAGRTLGSLRFGHQTVLSGLCRCAADHGAQ